MRILLYSHDSYGLGHIRRCVEISKQLARQSPYVSQLLITGSMQAGAFELPDALDYIKLPALRKTINGEYRARRLEIGLDNVLDIRAKIIFETVRSFEPDLLLVDKAPAGIRGEMGPALHYLKAKRPRTRLVFGMRDIEDHAPWVRAEWTRDGIYPLLQDVYDAILLYGSRGVYDPVQEYGLSREIEAKMVACGYIEKSDALTEKKEVRARLAMQTDRLVVATAGGGEDGYDLLRAYLDMLRETRPRFDSVVVTGPLTDTKNMAWLDGYKSLPGLTVMQFTPDLLSYLNAADAVVSMGGYNSVCEILTLNQRAVIVPRVKPRMEQLIRGERLAARGLVRMVHPDRLTPHVLLREIETALASERPTSPQLAGIDMNGAANAGRAIARLLPRPMAEVATR